MKKRKFFVFFLAACLALSAWGGTAAASFAQAAPGTYSGAAIVVDRQTGRILFQKNQNVKVYPASLTKIMTVLLAVEAVESGSVSLTDSVTASANITYDLSSLGSTAGISVGETMSLEDLIYCAMLSSANEACNIIAEHVDGSISNFIDHMNRKARELGCAGTNFYNTHGLTSSNHYTTAADMARIALDAVRHTLFMGFCGTTDRVIPATNRSGERSLHNSNALISANSQYGSQWVYAGASGVKTGHTSYAGYCLASTAERGGVELLCVTLGAETSNGCFSDHTALLDWAFANYIPEETPTLALLSGVEVPPPQSENSIPDTGGPSITSSAAVVVNRDNGEIFYAKNAGSRVYPADTAKLMTALLAVEAIENSQLALSTETTVSSLDAYDLTSSANQLLKTGESVTLEDLLYLILLPSADDACNTVAELVCDSFSDFIARMNERAQRLGCTDTHFNNTHGLYDPNTYTTPADMALIAMEVMRHDILTRMCSAVSVEIRETNLSEARKLVNTNALLHSGSVYGGNYVYDRATGLKTGYNSGAGYCLVSTAEDNEAGIHLIAAVYGGISSNGFSDFSDTIQLYDYIFGSYSYQEVLSPNVNIASVDVNLGKDVDYVNLRPSGPIALLLPVDYDPNQFELDLQVYSLQQGKAVTAPVTAGEVLGEVSVLKDGQNCGTVKLVAAASVDLSRSQYIKASIDETTHSGNFRLIVGLILLILVLYAGLVVVYRMRRLRYRRALRGRLAGPAGAVDADWEPEPPEGYEEEYPELPEAYVEAPQETAVENFPTERYRPEQGGTGGGVSHAGRRTAGNPGGRRNGGAGEWNTSRREPPQSELERAAESAVRRDPFAAGNGEDPFAGIDLFDSNDDKDYFEDFFRKK